MSPGPAPPRDDAVANDLISRHEALRTYLGIPPLGVDPGMNDHAQFHADRLATQAVGCQLWHSPELATWYAGFSAGENVACYESGTGVCPSDGKILMDEWVNSPPHLANILNGGFAWMGVGAACSGGRLFGVVQFRSS